MRKTKRMQSTASGIQETRNCAQSDCESSFSNFSATPLARIRSRSWLSSGETVRNSCRFLNWPWSLLPFTVVVETSPRSTAA